MFDGAKTETSGDHKYVSNGTGWAPALGAEAQRLWIAGKSAGAIVKMLSTPAHKLTRNAVISYIHRTLPEGTKRATAAPLAMGRRFAWTPDRRQHAADLKAANHSPTEIAARINAELTEDERVSVHSVRAMLQRDAGRGGPPSAYMAWSREAQKAIGELWQAGHSDGAVVRMISGKYDGGRTLPRASVRMIAERAGYARPAGFASVRAPLPAKAAPVKGFEVRKPGMAGGSVRPASAEAGAAPRDYVTPAEAIVTLDVSLLQRSARCCGFVTGENDQGFLYCGLPVDTATRQKAYCADHHAQMHKPLPPRGQQRVRSPSEGVPRLAASVSGRGSNDSFLSRWG